MTLTELLREYGIAIAPETHEHFRRGWDNVDCPWCHQTGHFRFGIPKRGKTGNCWNCGRHSVYETLTALGVPGHRLKDVYDDEIPTYRTPRTERGRLILPAGLGRLETAHTRYLVKRAFDPSILVRYWGIQGINHSGGSLSWRVFIPIEYEGKVISWTTRTIGDDGIRYLSASPQQEVIPHKSIVYGWDYVRSAVVICEGPLDVWKVGPGAVATFGTSWTYDQLLLLSQVPYRVICYDAEPTAQRAAGVLGDALQNFPGTTINCLLESGKDPGEASENELTMLRKMLNP